MTIESVRYGTKYAYITLDSGIVIKILIETALSKGVRTDCEVTEKEVNELHRLDQLLRCKQQAFSFLSRRLHSKYELKNKLKLKEYSIDIITETVDYLESRGYLNDEEYARVFFRSKMELKRNSINKIELQLLQKGIEKHIITQMVSEFSESNRDLEIAFLLAEKKLRVIRKRFSDKYKLKEKLYNFLKYRGFKNEVIFNVISNLLERQK